MRYITAASLALAFALASASAWAACPGHVQTVSTPSPVVADGASPTPTPVVVPSGG